MIEISTNAPERARECVRFANDGRFGLLISAEKSRSDAAIFRWIADLMATGKFAGIRKDDVDRAVGSLRSFAHQYDMAAAGEDPKAP